MMEWMSGAVLAHGIRIHYHRTGGHKLPIVALHGAAENGLCWSRVAQALQAEYDVIMLDARGHGQSEAPPSGYTAEDHAPDVAAAIQMLGFERAVIMGHSMGGATAVATAAHFPEVARALILEDPPWGVNAPDASTPAERAARSLKWREGLLKRKTQPLEEIVAFGRRRNPRWDEVDLAAWANALQQTSPNIASDITAREIRWQDVVRLVQCPVLVLTADKAAGAIVAPEAIAEAKALCPSVESVHIGDAGHNIRREQFAAFVAAVRQFLRKIYP